MRYLNHEWFIREELSMNEKGQRMNSRAFVPVAPSNEMFETSYRTTASLYIMDQLSEEEELEESWSDCTTPTQIPASHGGWSDITLTGSLTGRSSYGSWEEDEAVLDRLAGEQVGRMFNAVERSLYEGQSTGQDLVDQECLEWRNNFPHFRVNGVHLLDSLEDGTEIVDPLVVEDKGQCEEEQTSDETLELAVVGRAMKIHPPPPLITGESSEEPPPGLHYEEVLATDGVVEEYFAYNYDTESTDDRSAVKRAAGTHRYRKLPPVTPSACLRDSVFTLVFDQIWTEVATCLHPLLIKYSRIASRRNSFSENISLSPSNSHVPVHEFSLLTDEAPPTRAGHGGIQSLKRRPVPSGPLAPGGVVSTHIRDLPSLQKVMTIKPVSLQQRIPSSTLPPSLSSVTSNFQPHIPIEGSGSTIFRVLSSRFLPNPRQMSMIQTPIPPRASEPKLVSGKISNKRNPLKPLEVLRTPGLPLMDDDLKEFSGLRGQRLIRHTQLPPLDPSQFEMVKSPQMPCSSGTKGRVTFSNRIVSAVTDSRVDSGRVSRRTTLVPGVSSELRPNTSQTLQRVETPLTRRGSNNSIGLNLPLPISSSPIKVIGYAANLHGDGVLWEEQEEGLDEITPSSYNGPNPRLGHSRSTKVAHGPFR